MKVTPKVECLDMLCLGCGSRLSCIVGEQVNNNLFRGMNTNYASVLAISVYFRI